MTLLAITPVLIFMQNVKPLTPLTKPSKLNRYSSAGRTHNHYELKPLNREAQLKWKHKASIWHNYIAYKSTENIQILAKV